METHTTIEVVEFCHQYNIGKYAEIVGRWIWLDFPVKPPDDLRQALKDFGFRWSPRRGRWAHNCGYPSRAGRRDPRLVYGCSPLDETEAA